MIKYHYFESHNSISVLSDMHILCKFKQIHILVLIFSYKITRCLSSWSYVAREIDEGWTSYLNQRLLIQKRYFSIQNGRIKNSFDSAMAHIEQSM